MRVGLRIVFLPFDSQLFLGFGEPGVVLVVDLVNVTAPGSPVARHKIPIHWVSAILRIEGEPDLAVLLAKERSGKGGSGS